VIAVIDPRQANLSSRLFLGNLSLLLAALTWALYSVLVRRVTRNLDTLPVSLVTFLGGMFFALPMAVWEQSAVGWGPLSVGALLGVLYVGLISTALAMFLWNSAFAHLEAGVAALTFFAQPVVGAALGALFLGERLTPMFLLGGGLIGLGLVLSISREKAD
jgi:drug/metabolite transporter (DMT)-like permease